ncbi:MAG: DUF167 domain-containing protein [Gallionellaceae bacterium]|nr:DUF167 domain-containing protein [Gallionellaceae bacterium]MDD5367024.1 DUF167 domain-containing protein [Gallionellaceae bacterium]
MTDAPVWLAAGAHGGSEITLHVQPGASKSELAGLHGDALKLRISARPVEGAANAAVLEFLAAWLNLPKRDLKLLRGDKSRRKTVWAPIPPEQVPSGQ